MPFKLLNFTSHFILTSQIIDFKVFFSLPVFSSGGLIHSWWWVFFGYLICPWKPFYVSLLFFREELKFSLLSSFHFSSGNWLVFFSSFTSKVLINFNPFLSFSLQMISDLFILLFLMSFSECLLTYFQTLGQKHHGFFLARVYYRQEYYSLFF